MRRHNVIQCLILAWYTLGLATAQRPSDPPEPRPTSVALTRAELTRERFGLDPEGPNHRIQDVLDVSTNAAGMVVTITNQVAVLADGLNYWNGVGWVEAEPVFELRAGYATATKVRHQVNIGGNLNVEGALALRMPDNQPFRATVHGLAYHDLATGKSVLLSPIQDAQAYLIAANQILYKNAFVEIDADVRYTLSRNGLEQDIVIHQQLPKPERYGFSSATTRLEVWTEVFDAPEAVIRRERPIQAASSPTNPALLGDDDDEQLDFGSMSIPPGHSFRVGRRLDPSALVAVRKSWAKIGPRRFLVESVDLLKVAETLDDLPPPRPGGAFLRPTMMDRQQALQALPVKSKAKDLAAVVDAQRDETLLAALEPERDGLLLDYPIIYNTSTETGAGFTFKADSTYWIKGTLSLGPFNPSTSKLVFQGGTVIKFARTDYATLTYPGLNTDCRVDCLGTMYRPVILTAEDDHTVGERLTSATGPTDLYAYQALILRSWSEPRVFDLNWLKVNRALIPINIGGGAGHKLKNTQILNSLYGLSANNADISIYNGLFANLAGGFHTGTPGSTPLRGEHLTLHNISEWLGYDVYPTLVNSLLVQVPVATSGRQVGASGATLISSAVESGAAGVFASGFQGNYYLPANSPHRNVGTTAINSQLAIDLRQLTTERPVQLLGPINADSTFGPCVARDLDIPDRGYHYAPLDYYGSNVQVNSAKLNLVNGVAVAGYPPGLFTLTGTARLSSVGRPENLNRLTTYQTVQEQDAYPAPGSGTPPFGLINGGNVALRFTEVSFPAAPVNSRRVFSENFDGTISLVDSHLRGGYWKAWNYLGSGYTTSAIAITNSLFESCRLEFSQGYGEANQPYYLALTVRNCLLTQSSLDLKRSLYYYGHWNIIDNLLDNCTGSMSYFSSYSGMELLGYNAYTTATAFLQDWSSRVNLSRDFIAGPLGGYYYPATGSGSSLATLIDQGWNGGGISAASLGLFHHSVVANGSREGVSRIDIGFHRIALNSVGLPVDTDGDGVADYLEDKNGNGQFDAGTETDWLNGGVSSGTVGLKIYSVRTK